MSPKNKGIDWGEGGRDGLAKSATIFFSWVTSALVVAKFIAVHMQVTGESLGSGCASWKTNGEDFLISRREKGRRGKEWSMA